jgi:hypothetical protein
MKLLAQANNNFVGTIVNPLNKYGDAIGTGNNGGLVLFITNIIRLVFVAGGVYALFNFIIAGYGWMMAAGDSKAITAAWARIWQTLLGLVIMAGSFVLAALASYIIFGDASYILNPHIWGP